MKFRYEKKAVVFILTLALLMQGSLGLVYAEGEAAPNTSGSSVITTSEPAVSTTSEPAVSTTSEPAVSTTSGPSTGRDVTQLLKATTGAVYQNNIEVPIGGKLDYKKSIEIRYGCEVPVLGDNYSADPDDVVGGGDYAVFPLPDGLILSGVTTQNVMFGSVKIGEATFAGNEAKVVFDANLDNKNYSNVRMTLKASMKYDDSGNNGDEGSHGLDIFGKIYTITMPKKPTEINGEKSGKADVTNGIVQWQIKVTADDTTSSSATDDGDLKGFTFSDDLKTVGGYVDGSFMIGDTTDSSLATTAAVNYDSGNKNLSYKFTEEMIGTRYLFFQTNISQENLDKSGEQTIKNTAKMKVDGYEKAFSGEVKLDMGWIKKEGDVVAGTETTAGGIYNPNQREIQWEIIINERGVTLTAAAIKDKLAGGLTWKSAKLEIWDTATGAWTPSAVVFNNEPTDNVYKLGTISEKARLVINTIVAVDKTHTTPYLNTAELSWEGRNTGIKSNEKGVSVGFKAITKSAGAYDHSTHEMEWNVGVDTRGLTFGGNLRVIDLLVYGDGNKFKVGDTYAVTTNEGIGNTLLTEISTSAIGGLTPKSYQKYVKGSLAGAGLEFNVYTLEKDGKAVADVIVVTSSGGVGLPTSSGISFSFKTLITNPDFYASNGKKTIENAVTLFSSDTAKEAFEAKKEIEVNMLSKGVLSRVNAEKVAQNSNDLPAVNDLLVSEDKGFNYIDKSMIFRIQVNGDGLKDATNDITSVDGISLGSIVVKDELPEGWEFKDITAGGIKFLIYEGATSAGVQVNANALKSDYESFLTGVAIASPTTSAGGTFSATFTKLEKPYIILLKAGPTNEKAAEYFSANKTHQIKNNVKISYENDSSTPSTFVDYNIKSDLVTKTLDKSKIESHGSLTWTVEYHPYGLGITNASITDTLPIGIDLRTDAKGNPDMTGITVSAITLNADGGYSTPTAVTTPGIVEYESVTREIKFKIPDVKQAYRLEYITDVTGNPGEIKNEVKLSGEKISDVSEAVAYSIEQNLVAGFLNQSGWLTISKNDSSGKTLSGAAFTLYGTTGDKFEIDESIVIRKGISPEDGNVFMMSRIPEGKYILQETDAPIGYLKDSTQYKVEVTSVSGTFVTIIDEKTNEIKVVNVKSDTLGHLSLTKKLSGNAADPNKNFEFAIKFTSGTAALTGKFSYDKGGTTTDFTLDQEGKTTLNLKGDETALVKNLPQGIIYAITENNYTADGYTLDKSVEAAGVIVAESTKAAIFTNTKNSSPGGGGGGSSGATTGPPITPETPGVPPVEPPLTPGVPNVPVGPGGSVTPGSPEDLFNLNDPDVPKGWKDGDVAGVGNSRNGSPQTGDNAPIGMMIMSLIAALLGIAFLGLRKSKLHS